MKFNIILGSNLARNILHVEREVKKIKGFHLNECFRQGMYQPERRMHIPRSLKIKKIVLRVMKFSY